MDRTRLKKTGNTVLSKTSIEPSNKPSNGGTSIYDRSALKKTGKKDPQLSTTTSVPPDGGKTREIGTKLKGSKLTTAPASPKKTSTVGKLKVAASPASPKKPASAPFKTTSSSSKSPSSPSKKKASVGKKFDVGGLKKTAGPLSSKTSAESKTPINSDAVKKAALKPKEKPAKTETSSTAPPKDGSKSRSPFSAEGLKKTTKKITSVPPKTASTAATKSPFNAGGLRKTAATEKKPDYGSPASCKSTPSKPSKSSTAPTSKVAKGASAFKKDASGAVGSQYNKTVESKHVAKSFSKPGKLGNTPFGSVPSVPKGKESYDKEKLKETGKAKRQANSLLDASKDEKAILDGKREGLWLRGLEAKIKGDKNLEAKAMEFVRRIQAAGGMPQMRRLSIRDNDLVTDLNRAIANDPSLKEMVIKDDERFTYIGPALVVGFAEELRANMHLTRLTITKVELGNDFLSALASSMEANFTLEELDLSSNHFTSDALVDFCLAMAENHTLRTVNLRRQNSPIFKTREFVAIEALTKNEYLQEFQIEFQNKDCQKILSKVLKKNKEKNKPGADFTKKLLSYLENEAARAEQLAAERKQNAEAQDVQEGDWPYLYELHELATQYKLPYELESESKHEEVAAASSSNKESDTRIMPLTADGSFLTEEFISEYLEESPKEKRLTFEFNNQCKIFKRFGVADPARELIVKKFVDVLVEHPRGKDITHLHMSNTLLGNDWVSYLCERCQKDPTLLPKLHLVNFETNNLSHAGFVAIAKCIGKPETWKYLQAVKLDNQKQLLSSAAEDELARALCVNRSVIRLSLRVRNLLERRRIGNYVSRNMDLLRQARRWHAIKTGTLKERARNGIETMFDKIAANDASVKEVELVSDQVFNSLDPAEVIKAAQSFGTNSHVKKIKMSGLVGLDDKFGVAFAKSMETNTSVEKVDLENNAIGSEGLKAIVASLAKNKTITELLLRHQSKPMSSSDEEELPDLIKGNDTVIKLSIDIRSIGARDSVEKKIRLNQDAKRKKAAASKPADSTPKTRNRIEKLFDRVAENDSSLKEIEIVGDLVFTSLRPAEVTKAAESFASNTHVTRIKLSQLKLDDKFAIALAKSMETNTAVTKLDLESNSIGGDGLRTLVESLSKNNTISEMFLRHQSKPMSSADEELIPSLIDDNKTIVKLSIDIRSMGATNSLDKKLRLNQELKRKARLN